MGLRSKVADVVATRLSVMQPSGVFPPGADAQFRIAQPDGSEVTLISNGDSLTLITGKREFTTQRITPPVAIRLGWFLLWRWWVRGTWCGLKLAAWYWSIGVKVEELAESARRNR